MKDCKLIENNMIDFLEGTLSPELKEQISRHLEVCPACKELADNFASIWESVSEPEEIEVPSLLWASLQADLDRIDSAREKKSMLRKIMPVLQPIAAAAAIVIVVLLGTSFGNIQTSTTQSTSNAVDLWDAYGLDSFDQFPSGSMVDLYFNAEISGGNQS